AVESDSRARIGNRGNALTSKGHALWNLGFPGQALALAREGVMLGEDADNRYIYTTVLLRAGIIHRLCGKLAEAEDLFRKAFDLGTERGFPAIIATTTVRMGLMSALRGQVQTGLEQLRQGVELHAASSATFKPEPYTYAVG